MNSIFVGILWYGYIWGFFRKDTSNPYCGCYSCRLACVRCRPCRPIFAKNSTRNV